MTNIFQTLIFLHNFFFFGRGEIVAKFFKQMIFFDWFVSTIKLVVGSNKLCGKNISKLNFLIINSSIIQWENWSGVDFNDASLRLIVGPIIVIIMK